MKCSNYEHYIRNRAAYCGYTTPQDLAEAMEMSVSTLLDRLRGRKDWTLYECWRLQSVLRLSTREWILLILYRVVPYDHEYDAIAHSVFDAAF